MLVLKSIFPEIILVEVMDTQEKIEVLQRAYHLFESTARNLLPIFERYDKLIIQSIVTVIPADLYITLANKKCVAGVISEKNAQSLNEYLLVEDIFIDGYYNDLVIVPLKDTWIYEHGIPVIRKKIIDELLTEL